MQDAVADRHALVRRDDVYAIGLNPPAVLGLGYRHGGRARENLCKPAFVIRVEVLDDDKSHTRVLWQLPQQALDGFEAAG